MEIRVIEDFPNLGDLLCGRGNFHRQTSVTTAFQKNFICKDCCCDERCGLVEKSTIACLGWVIRPNVFCESSLNIAENRTVRRRAAIFILVRAQSIRNFPTRCSQNAHINCQRQIFAVGKCPRKVLETGRPMRMVLRGSQTLNDLGRGSFGSAGRALGCSPCATGAGVVPACRTQDYCKASINRVMVRFSSLSERRNSSILLMECSTVV